MDNLLANGDMVLNHCGDVQSVDGLKEIIQRVLIRLTVRKGNFPYDPQLGSELYHLDLHSTDDFTLLSIVREALAPIDEVVVTGVEKSVDQKQQILFLSVYIKVKEKSAIVEFGQKLW